MSAHGRELARMVLDGHRQNSAGGVLFEGRDRVLDRTTVLQELRTLGSVLAPHLGDVVGILGDNTPAWGLLDLALLESGCCSLPLPAFFSDRQLAHTLTASGCRLVIAADGDRIAGIAPSASVHARIVVAGESWTVFTIDDAAASPLPPGTAKITFTSGSTGAPKGVCLSATAMLRVARSLATAAQCDAQSRHLCVMPLATLLENIAGIYAPLLHGGTVVVPGAARVGMTGSSGFDAARCLGAIEQTRATSLILVPATLRALMHASFPGDPRLRRLRFVAVGGAPVTPDAVEAARSAGWPLHVGYGLSECCSVLCLGTPSADRRGSVGRALPHVRLRVAADGGIEAAGSTFLGYLGEPPCTDEWAATGDLGTIDDDGYVFVHGRRKHVFVTAFGRNVNPEWIEATLQESASIAQAVAFGEGMHRCRAVLVPAAGCDADDVAAAVARANAQLPDYARVGDWMLADTPFMPANGCWTASGKPIRHAIAARHTDFLSANDAERSSAHPPAMEYTPR